MQRAVLAVLVAILMTSAPASAQLFPTQAPPTERVLIDLAVNVWPVATGPHCMALPPGTVTATVKRTREADEPRPARFTFWGFQADAEAMMQMVVTGTEISSTMHVNGASDYCYELSVKAPEATDADRPTRQRYVQQIAVRITHRPD